MNYELKERKRAESRRQKNREEVSTARVQGEGHRGVGLWVRLKKQSQFGQSQIDVTTYFRKDYGKMPGVGQEIETSGLRILDSASSAE